jgi:transcriptional regulator with XRE-family HTH domain
VTYDWDGLAAAIRIERARRKWSQSGLAKLTDVSQGTIKNLEGAHSYKKPPVGPLQAIDRAFGWPTGTCEGILQGQSRVPETAAAANESSLSPALQPLRERLPKRVQMELDNGEILDTEIYDLTVGGGTKMITIVIADPQNGPRDYAELRRTMRAWERVKRRQRGYKPLPWEPGDPEEWKTDSEV